MNLKLKKETVKTVVAYLSADANEELIENFRHDWLMMEAEIEWLSNALKVTEENLEECGWLGAYESVEREREKKKENEKDEPEEIITLAEEIANDQEWVEDQRESL